MNGWQINLFTFIQIIILTCLTSCGTQAIPQISDLVRLRPHVFYTIARRDDKLEFMCDRRQKTILWILPNNHLVELNQTALQNETIEFQDLMIVITPVSLNHLFM